MIKPKHILLVIILGLSAWALWPSAEERAGGGRLGDRPKAGEADKARRPYHLRVAPALYLPGTMPNNVGKPRPCSPPTSCRASRCWCSSSTPPSRSCAA